MPQGQFVHLKATCFSIAAPQSFQQILIGQLATSRLKVVAREGADKSSLFSQGLIRENNTWSKNLAILAGRPLEREFDSL